MNFQDNHTHQKYKIEDEISFIRNSYAHREITTVPNYDISCGIHPWYIQSKDWKVQIKYLEKLCKEKKICKIGECGLDKYAESNIDLQEEILKTQLELAKRFQLPVIIHCVKKYDELLEIIKLYPENQYYFHGYNGNISQTIKFLNTNIPIQFGFGMRELQRTTKIFELLSLIPTERIGLETDMSTISIKEVESLFSNLYDMHSRRA